MKVKERNSLLFVFFGLGALLGAGFSEVGCSSVPAGPRPVRIAVFGWPSVGNLVVTLTQRLRHFEQAGVRISVEELGGGVAKGMQAVQGGSADVAVGTLDQAIQLAAEGRRVQAFVTLLRYPDLVLVVSPATRRTIARIEDLRGAMVGVSSPGSTTHLFLNYLLARHRLTPDDVRVTGIGLTRSAAAAIERGQVDAAVTTTFGLAPLRDSGLRIIADARSAAGAREICGADTVPGTVFYATADWLETNPESARRLTRAFLLTLQWMRERDAGAILAALPESHRAPDTAAAVADLLPMLSPNGAISPDGAAAVERMLTGWLASVRSARVDVAATYTNRFVRSGEPAAPAK